MQSFSGGEGIKEYRKNGFVLPVFPVFNLEGVSFI